MKIVFTGGGTAGHVTPNLALIDKLQQEQCYYVGSDGMEKQLVEKYVAQGKVKEYCQISAYKFRRKLTLENFLLPFRLSRSVKEAKNHLKRIQPNVIFSKGGYVGLPVIIAGKKLGIPTVIHESDMSMGLANKLSAHFADVCLSSFDTVKHAQHVGAVIRQPTHGNRAQGLQTMGFDGSKPILLVTGGSLGAKALNDAVSACPRLAERFDIFVICGKNKQMGCEFVHQAEFISNMNDLFAAADVCLTRAGANILAELTLCEIPFAAVPLTKQSRGEQVQNARWFCDRGCGILLNENTLKTELYKAVNVLYDNRAAFSAKQRTQKNLYGTDKVVEILKGYK